MPMTVEDMAAATPQSSLLFQNNRMIMAKSLAFWQALLVVGLGRETESECRAAVCTYVRMAEADGFTLIQLCGALCERDRERVAICMPTTLVGQTRH